MTGGDAVLGALALLELASKLGGTDPLAEHLALIGPTCEHQVQALFLTALLLRVADETGFSLQALIDSERSDALTPEEPGGFA